MEPSSRGSAIRGRRIGGASGFESDSDKMVYAERRTHVYVCGLGHATSLVFHAEAVPPGIWTCSVCGVDAEHERRKVDGLSGPVEPVETKSHWDQLISRRTEAELEALLAEARSNYRRTGKAF